ncbi:MAG: cytochrome P450 [Chloroflexota bacterium]
MKLLWNATFKWKKPLTTITELHKTYGPLIEVKLGPRTTYFINDADLIKQILQDNNRNYVKQPLNSVENPLMGKGLLTSEGDFWRRQRRLAQPAFHRQQIDGFAKTMASATHKRLNGWEKWAKSGRSFDLADEMMMLTLDIVTRTLFGNALTNEETATINRLMVPILHGTRRHVIRSRWIGEAPNLPANRRYVDQIRQLDEIINRLIAERKKQADLGSDLLGMLLSVRDEETGEGMTDRQLRDEVMTLFMAGHETTANLMAWTWSLLGQHPAIEQGVRMEIESQLGHRPPGLADMANLPYTQMVLKESMRLFPPAWMTVRSPLEDDSWYGERLAAKSTVMICIYALHRSPTYWRNPEEFDPTRFANPAAFTHRYAYIPFGGGPRLCIGKQFAMLEATIILAMMMQRYKVHPSPMAPAIVPETAVTLRPKNGVWVQVTKR